jgi:hypothetical protein
MPGEPGRPASGSKRRFWPAALRASPGRRRSRGRQQLFGDGDRGSGTRQTIRRIARDNPSARIVVTAAMRREAGTRSAALPNVERVIVNDDKPRLMQLLATSGKNGRRTRSNR